MNSYQEVDTALRNLLGLGSAPVALRFSDEQPGGIKRVAKASPAGCGYWARAAQGESFYTEPSDHYNCTIGAHTHRVELPAEKQNEFEDVVGTFLKLSYIQESELPKIPQLSKTWKYASYEPLSQTAAQPDVVILRVNARQAMLLSEAGRLAGVDAGQAAMGRPACAAVPVAVSTGLGLLSVGCAGNRVYTHLGDGEMYYFIAGSALQVLVNKLSVIAHANQALQQYHEHRAATLS